MDTAENPEDMPLPAVAGDLDDATHVTDTSANAPAPPRSDRGRPGEHPDHSRHSDRNQHNKHGEHREHRSRGERSRRNRHRGSRPDRRRSTWHGYSPDQLAARAASVPALIYPEELPVSARRDEIAEAIRDNQVVIVAGETGSGKTTQLPKICLELGRGVTGMIGHTQPRRIAARSVAERIAHELGTRIGREGIIGYQVRFTEETGPSTLVKLMTDGILLAEIQSDPMLSRYDTIIVDEAHERSLTIDFILGYLARLLPRRPDLKVIITSATIDSARFAEHFGRRENERREAGDRGESSAEPADPAPVIEVSGRTYPVEIRYRPLLADDGLDVGPGHTPHGAGGHVPGDDSDGPNSPDARPAPGPAPSSAPQEDRDQVTGILDAVDELMAAGDGDILVFLAGERDIRDTEAALIDHLGPRYTPDGRSRAPGARGAPKALKPPRPLRAQAEPAPGPPAAARPEPWPADRD